MFKALFYFIIITNKDKQYGRRWMSERCDF